LKYKLFQTISNGEITKTKVVKLEKLYNFIYERKVTFEFLTFLEKKSNDLR